jgi:8-oxo-dGTP diphosphatase
VPADGWVEPVAWHASLPGVVLSAAALIGDGRGRVLLVKPNYREHWTLPGGICEFLEAPHDGCAREVAEELGLPLTPGPLLSVDWHPSQAMYGSQARPVTYFIFDGGTLDSTDGIRLQASELDECLFVAEAEVGSYLLPASVPRVTAAMGARSTGCARYVPAGGS